MEGEEEVLAKSYDGIVVRSADTYLTGRDIFLRRVAGERPAILYHYASADALKGIVASGRLYGSNIEFLNDSSEGNYGRGLFCEEIERHAGDEAYTVFLASIAQHLSERPYAFDVYVASMTDGNDILPQWQGYAARGSGYAIGFDAARLGSAGVGGVLMPVIYDTGRQRLFIRALLKGFAGVFTRTLDAQTLERSALTQLLIHFMATATPLIHGFKPALFAHEREWRLIRVAQRDRPDRLDGVAFRVSRGVVVPYVEFPFEDTENRLTIREIRCGPTIRHEAVIQGVEMLVAKSGLKDVTVSQSTAPVRF